MRRLRFWRGVGGEKGLEFGRARLLDCSHPHAIPSFSVTFTAEEDPYRDSTELLHQRLKVSASGEVLASRHVFRLTL